MYKLNYYVPVDAKEATKEALFQIGVGKFENYEYCAWESLGRGQFKPLGNANPHIGKLDTLEYVQEYKAVETLKKAHPYEEVAYEVFKMEDF